MTTTPLLGRRVHSFSLSAQRSALALISTESTSQCGAVAQVGGHPLSSPRLEVRPTLLRRQASLQRAARFLDFSCALCAADLIGCTRLPSQVDTACGGSSQAEAAWDWAVLAVEALGAPHHLWVARLLAVVPAQGACRPAACLQVWRRTAAPEPRRPQGLGLAPWRRRRRLRRPISCR